MRTFNFSDTEKTFMFRCVKERYDEVKLEFRSPEATRSWINFYYAPVFALTVYLQDGGATKLTKHQAGTLRGCLCEHEELDPELSRKLVQYLDD